MSDKLTDRILLANGRGFAIVDAEDYVWLSKHKWRNKNGYAYRNIYRENGKRSIISMNNEIMQTPPGMHTDHINRNKLDNRKSNLRICTPSQNSHNANVRVDNTTGYRGVSLDKKSEKYDARTRVPGRQICLGLFVHDYDAAQAYNLATYIHHGKLAHFNTPKEQA